jgi:hypothetical protein
MFSEKVLKGKTDRQLADEMSGLKIGTTGYILCEMEFKRRQNIGNEIRGWIALGLASLAICVSVAALIATHCPS